jgi:hypothetical protein
MAASTGSLATIDDSDALAGNSMRRRPRRLRPSENEINEADEMNA